MHGIEFGLSSKAGIPASSSPEGSLAYWKATSVCFWQEMWRVRVFISAPHCTIYVASTLRSSIKSTSFLFPMRALACRDRGVVEQWVRTAERLGFKALMVTVDAQRLLSTKCRSSKLHGHDQTLCGPFLRPECSIQPTGAHIAWQEATFDAQPLMHAATCLADFSFLSFCTAPGGNGLCLKLLDASRWLLGLLPAWQAKWCGQKVAQNQVCVGVWARK
eukprot:scaffold211454_cov18-Tisochrysis_lutea.AAC.1